MKAYHELRKRNYEVIGVYGSAHYIWLFDADAEAEHILQRGGYKELSKEESDKVTSKFGLTSKVKGAKVYTDAIKKFAESEFEE